MMKQNQKTELLKLERREVKWYCAVRRARLWFRDNLGQPARPYLILVVEGGTEALRGYSLMQRAPQADDFEKALIDAMQLSGNKPKIARFKRYRPAQIVLEDQILVQALTPGLADAGVDILLSPSLLQIMDRIILDFNAYIRDDKRPGLLEIAGISTPMAAEYFAAAHDFYKAKPWTNIDNLTFINVRYPANDASAKEYCMVIMGNGGMEFGLACYNSVDDIKRMMDERKARESRKTTTHLGITFDVATQMPFGDHDAVEKYGWPIAGSRAYPAILKHHPRKGIIAPDPEEVALFAAALRAIPGFVRSHLDPRLGLPKPASVTYELPAAHEGKQITLHYTGEDLLAGGQVDDVDDKEDRADEIIDNPDQVAALLKLINQYLPIPCKPMPALIEQLRGQPNASLHHGSLRIDSVFDSGNDGGIMAGILPLGKDGAIQVVSLTMVKIAPTHPIYSAVHAYQKRRRSALR